MAAISEYPVKGDPIVRGDPLIIKVTINSVDDPSDWLWAAQVRSTADSKLLFSFDIVKDDTDPHVIYLSADAQRTRLLSEGCGFDLEQGWPVQQTWWICPCLHVRKDYTKPLPAQLPEVTS